MGLSFKEDINDVRNSKAKDIIKHLRSYGIEVAGYEPHVSQEGIKKELNSINQGIVDVTQQMYDHNRILLEQED